MGRRMSGTDLGGVPTLVVLGGGLGTRLAPVARGRPKPLVEIVPGVAILQHVLEHWRDRGARRVMLCLGHCGPEVSASVGAWELAPLQIEAVVEPRRMGTAGAIALILTSLPDEFIVANGDTIMDVSLSALVRWHRYRPKDGTVVLSPADPSSDGHRFVVGPDRRVIGSGGRDRRGGGWVSAGINVLSKRLFEDIPLDHPTQIEEHVLQRAIAAGHHLTGLCTRRRFWDLGTPGRLDVYRRAMWGGGEDSQ